jgi:hypothetical protein
MFPNRVVGKMPVFIAWRLRLPALAKVRAIPIDDLYHEGSYKQFYLLT